jgi:hypothetical protein
MFCARRLDLDQQEIKMNASIRALTGIGFILAVPLFAIPVLGAAAHEEGHRTAHHRVADFAKARALASPESYVPAPRRPETDGLSRNPDDCAKLGCIDNGGG